MSSREIYSLKTWASTVNETLLKLERRCNLGPTYVARMLGVAYTTYAAYRSGARELPLYIERSAKAHIGMSEEFRQALIKEHAYATRNGR